MKSFIVLVFMIFALVGSTKAEGWTNAGEFSYLYPNGTKQISDYTLTEDGKSIVVLTLDSSNSTTKYNQYKLQRIDLETGVTDFDTLWITNKYTYKLSKDGLTAFEVEGDTNPVKYAVVCKLFNIYHSSRGYLYNDTIISKDGVWYFKSYTNINFINYIPQYKSILFGTSFRWNNELPPGSAGTSGQFQIFDINDSKILYRRQSGESRIYDTYHGTKCMVFDQSNNQSKCLVLVDSNKKETILFERTGNYNVKYVKLIRDSVLISQVENKYDNTIYFYVFCLSSNPT